jgi:hypothetical protein
MTLSISSLLASKTIVSISRDELEEKYPEFILDYASSNAIYYLVKRNLVIDELSDKPLKVIRIKDSKVYVTPSLYNQDYFEADDFISLV